MTKKKNDVKITRNQIRNKINNEEKGSRSFKFINEFQSIQYKV